jgi:hypothetical protein
MKAQLEAGRGSSEPTVRLPGALSPLRAWSITLSQPVQTGVFRESRAVGRSCLRVPPRSAGGVELRVWRRVHPETPWSSGSRTRSGSRTVSVALRRQEGALDSRRFLRNRLPSGWTASSPEHHSWTGWRWPGSVTSSGGWDIEWRRGPFPGFRGRDLALGCDLHGRLPDGAQPVSNEGAAVEDLGCPRREHCYPV